MVRHFTPVQGRYLAYLYWYTKLNGRPPAEADLQGWFKTSPSAVHQMVLTLETKGLIKRTPGQARSIRLLLSSEEIPDLDTGEPTAGTVRSLVARFPSIAEWVSEYGRRIEIGHEYYTGTFVRALDPGGMPYGGGDSSMTLDEAFRVLDHGIDGSRKVWE